MASCVFWFFVQVYDVDLLYFGLTFYHMKAQLPVSGNKVSVKDIKGTNLERIIAEDKTTLRQADIDLKGHSRHRGYFVKVDLEGKNVFIYRHDLHANCSSIKLSQLKQTSIQIKTVKSTVETCETKGDHYHLIPFYSRNDHLLAKYNKLAQEVPSEELQEEITALKSALEEKKTYGTAFQEPHPITFNWDENHWTRRLAYGMGKKLRKNFSVTYTADFGPRWETEILPCLGVEQIATRHFYLFHGAPDILIGRKRMVSIGTVATAEHQSLRKDMAEEVQAASTPRADDQSEDELLENSYQRFTLKGETKVDLPEKLGEVYAGLYILLVSKILKQLQKNKTIYCKYKIRGMLIDKVCGAIHCQICIVLMEGIACETVFQLEDCSGMLLDAELLCAHINRLVSN